MELGEKLENSSSYEQANDNDQLIGGPDGNPDNDESQVVYTLNNTPQPPNSNNKEPNLSSVVGGIGHHPHTTTTSMSNNQDPHDTSYLNKDEPIAAVYVARKLFCDFVQLVNKKIDSSLAKDARDKPIYKPLQPDEDPTYYRILEAIEAISEFCLPSLLKNSLAWYQNQLGTGPSTNTDQPVGSPSSNKRASSLSDCPQNQPPEKQEHPQSTASGQPCSLDLPLNTPRDNTNTRISPHPDVANLTSMSSVTIRSPTPSSPDTSNQLSILTALPSTEAQMPSLNITSTNNLEPTNQSSTANTSTSTATNVSSNSLIEDTTTNTIAHLELIKTRKLLIEYALCQILLKIFTQLHLHPGHANLISQVEDIAFEHFKCNDQRNDFTPNDLMNINRLADKFAEVLGLLAQTRFKLVRKRFMFELNELRSIKEPTPHHIQCIVTLLPGLKCFRVKMAPIEEFQASFQLLQELADYFVEVRHKSIRHALAGLFVEIMTPLTSTVRNEVKIPCLKTFIDTLWLPTFEMCSRKKHSISLFPLVTCLLCLSQRNFFLSNWQAVLNLCLSNLKNRDQKMCRIAFECLYRLIWTYMDRIKCESNVITQTRLTTIMEVLFPKGGRSVVPRDTPITMFIDIIRFIGQERLDFAMKHIIFDLLSVDRPFKVIIAPERMYIGLKAFLVIVDGLQQKESDSSMLLLSSSANGHLGFNSVRKIQSTKILTDEVARAIGISPFHSQIQRSFNDILKALDSQVGKPLLLSHKLNPSSKDADESASAERKTKIDLFKACLKALPRLTPDGMTRMELIELLSRLTIHVDEDMRKCAVESLTTLVSDFPDWRLDTIDGFTTFLREQIDDTLKQLVESALKTLCQLLSSWHNAITLNSSSADSTTTTTTTTSHEQSNVAGRRCSTRTSISSSSITIQTGYETIATRNSATGGQVVARKNRALAEMRLIQSELSSTPYERLVGVIQKVEGALFIMLCSCQPSTRKLSSHLLRETRAIIKCYSSWCCMEQLNFRSPEDGGTLGKEEDDDEDSVEADEGAAVEDLSVSLKGSLSADNLSRITTTSAGLGAGFNTAGQPNCLLSASISRMCLAGGQQASSTAKSHHDAYDSDSENNLRETICGGDNSGLIFWTAMIMLESDNEQEFTFALRLLETFVPNIPFEQPSFIEELEMNLRRIGWSDFPGLHALVLKGCVGSNYALSISILDSLTPALLHPICSTTSSANSNIFPLHTMVLLTQLLSDYEDPSAFSMNIARRIAIWCDENQPSKLENLSAVMSLYSRRCFSKDGFQWTKCVIKYLYDAYSDSLHTVIPLLVDMLEGGPAHVQRLIPPILYCILNYIDVTSTNMSQSLLNAELARLYNKLLATNTAATTSSKPADGHKQQPMDSSCCWRDAVQIFKLIISRSSSLDHVSIMQQHQHQGGYQGRELPGRTLEFSVDFGWFGQQAGWLSAGAPINHPPSCPAMSLPLRASAAAAASPLSAGWTPTTVPSSSGNNNNSLELANVPRRPASWLPAASGRFRLSFVGRVGACASLARSSLPA